MYKQTPVERKRFVHPAIKEKSLWPERYQVLSRTYSAVILSTRLFILVLLLDLDGGNKQKDGGKLDFDSATARLLDLIDGHQGVI